MGDAGDDGGDVGDAGDDGGDAGVAGDDGGDAGDAGDAGAGAVATTLERFSREFRDAFDVTHEAMRACRHVKPLPVVVPTITFTGKFDATHLPVDAMRLAAELAEELEQPLAFALAGDAKRVAQRAKKKRRHDGAGAPTEVADEEPATKRKAAKRSSGKTFRCQLSLEKGGKSVKLFHNGSVHVTGCGSPLEFLALVEALREFMVDTAGVRARLLSFDIHMVNAMFTLTCPLTGRPMTVAPGALMRRLPVRADMDPENNPSVKVPHIVDGCKVATAFVFQTGNVNVLGAKRPAHMASCVRAMCAMLDDAAPHVCAPDKVALRTTTSKNGLVLSDGYPFPLLACCTF